MLRKNARAMMLGVLCTALASTGAMADGLGLSRTRIVMGEKDKGAEITLRNEGDSVYLVQASVTPMEPDTLSAAGLTAPAAVETGSRTPFMVTPPLFRSEPHGQNVLRILRNGGDFPKDRESMLSFRFRGIPAAKKVDAGDGKADALGASLAIALGMSVKFIYRPDGLPFPVEKAASRLTLKRYGSGLKVSNPTPYYLTFASLTVGGKPVDMEKAGSMIAPFSYVIYPSPAEGREAKWSLINDFGGATETVQAEVQ